MHFAKTFRWCFIILLLSLSGISLGGGESENARPLVEYVAAGELPFSEVVRVGNMLYLSGQIGFDEDAGRLVDGGIKVETRQVLTNIENVLEKQGSSMDKVVRCVVMLADMKQFATMNQEYRSFFIKNLPARSTFGVAALALGANVEIECTALVN